MKRNLTAALLALAFVGSATVVAFATEAPKSDEPAKPLYMAKCPSPCDFTVKSHDKAEIVSLLKQHAKDHHNGMELSDADANGMVKE
ncbi:MAG: DUF1059 domain-containing protein, partial [Verrucomicrobia bacterium]|nr:DUF1059 domain-containing protein [Verrucomicrobiota bacterium]